MIDRRSLLLGGAALPLVQAAPARADGRTKIVWWHAMTGANAEQIGRIVSQFNASQPDVELTAIYKGGYADTLTAAIAAFRAGQAPHILQVFEVGTGTMLAAGPAVKQVWQLAAETGVALKPDNYIPSVRGYYSLADGRMASMPFNSSTAVTWYNKDAFVKAGLDPEHFPATWPEVVKLAQTLASKQPTPIAVTTDWFTWIQLEEYSAIHNIPYASEADGFKGLDAVLEANSPAHVRQLQRILDMAKDGSFKYMGRDSAPGPVFHSGQAAISFGSSAARGDIVRNAKFRFGEAFLPYDPEIIDKPINSIIGGASLWTMTAPGRTPAEYRAVAGLLAFIAHPDQDALWSQKTGYVPVTQAGYELSTKQGYYAANPGVDIPVQQLLRGKVTDNSRGLRLGRLPEIRNIMYEEIESALQGKQTAQQALDNAVTRGNQVLRQFEKSARG